MRQSQFFVGTIKTVTLKKMFTNKYFVLILVDDRKTLPELIKDVTRVSGVELRLSQFATVASP